MSLLTKGLRGLRRHEVKELVGYPAPGWAPPAYYLPTTAGVRLSGDIVLGSAAAWASVTLIARSCAQLPLHVYRRNGDAKEMDRDNPLYALLHDAPNDLMTAFTWRSVLQGHVEQWGNHYAEIERNGNDRIIGIHPRPPQRFRVEFKAGKKVFFYSQPDTGKELELRADQIFHVPAFSPDGLVGYSPVSIHRHTFALGAAALEYGTRVFEHDARPSVVLTTPKHFSDRAVDSLRQSWMANHSGPENAGKVALLEDGVTVSAFGFPPEDAQYLETRKFQREETDDIFGIPIGFRSSASEEMAIKFVVHTLGNRLVMLEQEIKRQLIPEEDVFAEHAVEGLLRGNSTARAAFYASGRTNGWLSVDEIRSRENYPPLPDGLGQTFMQPLNMQPVGGSEGSPDRNPSPSTGNPDSPGAERPLDDLSFIEATQGSRNGRTPTEMK